MATKKGIDSVREYFTDEEWSNMPDTTKQRYANLKENYDLMVKLGLKPQVLKFMKSAKRSVSKEGERGALSSVEAEILDMELGRGPAESVASTKFLLDERPTQQATASLTKLSAHIKKVPIPSQETSCDMSSMKVSSEASLIEPWASTWVQGYVNHERFELVSDCDRLFCDDCQKDYPGDCPLHGPLIHVKNTPVPPGDEQRAKKSLPDGLAIRRTTLRGTGYGVYATNPLPKRLCFGPYEGVPAGTTSMNVFFQQGKFGLMQFPADGLSQGGSNWMRFVNRPTHPGQHNLVAFQCAGAVYYRTCKAVGTYEELIVSFNASENVQEQNAYGKVPVVEPETQEDSEIGTAPRGIISCELCGECYSSHKYFLRHQMHQHAERLAGKYKCSHCDYSNNYKFVTAQHEWSHTGEKPFSCEICQRSFSWKSSLHNHLISHTREKPFECAECGERFTCSSHMLRHKKAHSEDVRPFVCPVCEKGYARKDYLKIHIRTHTAEKEHACGVCGRRFTDRSNAKKHEMSVHAKQFPLSCPHCGKGFASRREVRRHVFRRHERQGDH
ncbi:histone-lysine N-methyltransferase PRDM7-like [Amblyomma americanum]